VKDKHVPDNISPQSNTSEVDIIAAKDARLAIRVQMNTTLGDNWASEWAVIHNADYLVRVTKGNTNMDFQCDLLGHVDVIERPINPLQASGRFIAWTILISTLFIAFFIASTTGVIR
jgi:hypothetical protein